MFNLTRLSTALLDYADSLLMDLSHVLTVLYLQP